MRVTLYLTRSALQRLEKIPSALPLISADRTVRVLRRKVASTIALTFVITMIQIKLLFTSAGGAYGNNTREE